MERRQITEQEIEAKRTPKRGFTRADTAAWGVPWPLPPGWKKALLRFGVPYQKGRNDDAGAH
jgi:hypothetical protein